MSGVYPVPKENEIHEMLSMLYGDGFELDSGEPVSVEDGKSMVAVYVNDTGDPSTACVCNYNFAAFAAAALTKIPVGGAEDAAETGDFSDMMLSNIHEIMNICSRIFMDDSSPHIKLDKVYKSLGDAPDDVRTMLDKTEESVDFNVTIPGYGDGAISFLCGNE